MKKIILSLAVLAVTAISATAQKSKASNNNKMEFSVGGDLGFVVGDMSSFASLAYGGDLQVEYPTSSSFGLTLSAGYMGYSGKNGFSPSGQIPVMLGGRYYFSSQVYGSAQAGVSFYTTSGGGSAFTFAPGVGMKVNNNFDLLLKYQSATKNNFDNSFVGIRAAYIFK